MEHSDDSELMEEIKTEVMRLHVQSKELLDKLHSRKRKPEEPSTEDINQKKPKESQEEIKLALTEEGFSEDMRKALKALETRDVNRLAVITQLWEFWKKCKKDRVCLEAVASFDDRPRWVSRWLLRPLLEAMEEKEIAAVLALCALVLDQCDVYFEARQLLVKKGLAGPLVVIIESHLDQADIVERGLVVAYYIAPDEGKERALVVVILLFYLLCLFVQLKSQTLWRVWASSPPWRRS